MTITANEFLRLIFKVEKLGYTLSTNEDVYGGYEIVINYGKWGENVKLCINKDSHRYSFNYEYADFDELMDDLDRQLKARVIDKMKVEERFKQYLKLKEEFGND